MKTQIILYIVLALAIGLFGGYLFFGGEADSAHEHAAPMADQQAERATATIWTCSMHPQIQRDEPGDCPICGMDLIPQSSAGSSDPTVLTMTEAAVALARVRTTVIGGTPAGGTEEEIASEGGIRLTGRLAADDRTAAVQSVNYPGRLERLFVTYPGERVTAGQRIATIYSPELVVAQEELLEAGRLADFSPGLLTAARNKLRNLKISAEQIAELERSGEVITNFPVYAERGGTVLEVRSRVGDYLTAGAPLYTLTDLSQLWALFDAYERNLSEVRVGDRVRFAVASVPEQTFTARVSFIDPLIDPATRTATIRAEVGNSRGRLKPEMFIEGTIRGASSVVGSALGTNASTGEFSVPKTAVLWTGDRSVVYVEVPDADVPTYQFREVVLSAATGSVYGVVSGLEAGERVVTHGAFSIDAAAQLNNQASMMNRDIIVQGREVEQVTALVIPDYSAEGSTDFRAQLWEVARAYLSFKDRMVASQAATPALLTPLQKAIAAVDMSQVRDDAHRYWMQQFEAITTHLGGVAGATDLAEQRRQFGFLSQALINALSAFGVDETLYVQHCPMAFSGAGANWLSADPSIRNPYFGDAMLTCGSTTDTLGKTQ